MKRGSRSTTLPSMKSSRSFEGELKKRETQMNRHSILAISAITALGLALAQSAAVAQQKSLKEQLVGAWTLVSCGSTSANGAKSPQCANPNGILILDAGGRYATVTANRDRPKFTTGNRLEIPAEQFKAAV